MPVEKPGAQDAGERELIVVGRVTVVVLMALTAVISPFLVSAGAVFNLILQIGAGTGLIYLLRWFWMRINAWSEITAMAVSCVAIYSLMFASGCWIYGRPAAASALTALALVASLALFPIMKRIGGTK